MKIPQIAITGKPEDDMSSPKKNKFYNSGLLGDIGSNSDVLVFNSEPQASPPCCSNCINYNYKHEMCHYYLENSPPNEYCFSWSANAEYKKTFGGKYDSSYFFFSVDWSSGLYITRIDRISDVYGNEHGDHVGHLGSFDEPFNPKKIAEHFGNGVYALSVCKKQKNNVLSLIGSTEVVVNDPDTGMDKANPLLESNNDAKYFLDGNTIKDFDPKTYSVDKTPKKDKPTDRFSLIKELAENGLFNDSNFDKD